MMMMMMMHTYLCNIFDHIISLLPTVLAWCQTAREAVGQPPAPLSLLLPSAFKHSWQNSINNLLAVPQWFLWNMCTAHLSKNKSTRSVRANIAMFLTMKTSGMWLPLFLGIFGIPVSCKLPFIKSTSNWWFWGDWSKAKIVTPPEWYLLPTRTQSHRIFIYMEKRKHVDTHTHTLLWGDFSKLQDCLDSSRVPDGISAPVGGCCWWFQPSQMLVKEMNFPW